MNPLRKAMVASLGGAAVGMVPFHASAGVIRHDVADSMYLDLAAEAEYSGVGDVLIYATSGNTRCSGTAIGGAWILTAAHCLDNAGTTTITYRAGGVTYTASSWIYHSSFDDQNLWAGYDIGLIQLTTEVTGVEIATLYTGYDEFMQVGTSVGFGQSGTGVSGATTSSGTKRAGENVIDAMGSSLLFADFDSGSVGDNLFGDATQLALEYLIAKGDSGGGLFIDVDGVTYLAGVNSFVFASDGSANADYGDGQAATRVTSYLDWISESTGLTFARAAVPLPHTVLLLLIGAAGMRARRRCRRA